MTRTLAIETATTRCGVAVGTEEGAVATLVVERDRRHVETLAPAIRHLLDVAGWSAADLDLVAVDVGPGLFTGMRVGIATAQGLAVATGCPVASVRSLDVLRVMAGDGGPAIAAVVDARRGEVFSSLTHHGRELRPATCDGPAALAAELMAHHRPIAIGDGASRYCTELEEAGALVVDDRPHPDVVLRLGLLAEPIDAAALDADYLRDADAVARFAVRAVGG